jgi:hypothetical protein
MISLRSQTELADVDHAQYVIRVDSNLCFYRVVLSGDGEATLIGPGVNETLEEEESSIENFSPEARALLIVLAFEQRQ